MAATRQPVVVCRRASEPQRMGTLRHFSPHMTHCGTSNTDTDCPFCAPSSDCTEEPAPVQIGGSRMPCELRALTVCNETHVPWPAEPGAGRVDPRPSQNWGKCPRSSAAPMAVCVMRIYPARAVGSGVSSGRRANWGGGGWRAGRRTAGTVAGGWVGRGGDGAPDGRTGAGADEGSAVMRGRGTEDERTERAREEGTGGGRRRRRWSLPANATRTRTRRRGGRRRRWAARFRRSAGSPCGG